MFRRCHMPLPIRRDRIRLWRSLDRQLGFDENLRFLVWAWALWQLLFSFSLLRLAMRAAAFLVYTFFFSIKNGFTFGNKSIFLWWALPYLRRDSWLGITKPWTCLVTKHCALESNNVFMMSKNLLILRRAHDHSLGNLHELQDFFVLDFVFFLSLVNTVPLHSLKYNSQQLNRRNRGKSWLQVGQRSWFRSKLVEMN